MESEQRAERSGSSGAAWGRRERQRASQADALLTLSLLCSTGHHEQAQWIPPPPPRPPPLRRQSGRGQADPQPVSEIDHAEMRIRRGSTRMQPLRIPLARPSSICSHGCTISSVDAAAVAVAASGPPPAGRVLVQLLTRGRVHRPTPLDQHSTPLPLQRDSMFIPSSNATNKRAASSHQQCNTRTDTQPHHRRSDRSAVAP